MIVVVPELITPMRRAWSGCQPMKYMKVPTKIVLRIRTVIVSRVALPSVRTVSKMFRLSPVSKRTMTSVIVTMTGA